MNGWQSSNSHLWRYRYTTEHATGEFNSGNPPEMVVAFELAAMVPPVELSMENVRTGETVALIVAGRKVTA